MHYTQWSVKSNHLVEFKVLPVTLIPGATVSGSEMVEHLRSAFHRSNFFEIHNHWKPFPPLIMETLPTWSNSISGGSASPRGWAGRCWIRPLKKTDAVKMIHCQHIKVTWLQGKEQEELQGEEELASWKPRWSLSKAKKVSVSAGLARTKPQHHRSLSYLSWRLSFHNSIFSSFSGTSQHLLSVS